MTLTVQILMMLMKKEAIEIDFFLQVTVAVLKSVTPPPPLYKLRQSPKLIRSLRLL